MNSFLSKIRAWIFIPADIANHMIWGLVIFIAASAGARLIGRGHWVAMAVGILTTALIACLWETVNHLDNPENIFDPRDVAAGIGGALLGALAGYLT